MSHPTALFDEQGNRWAIDHEIASGGEGVVYRVAGAEHLAAKVYTERPSQRIAAKLRHMVRVGSDALRRHTAWPMAILCDRPGGSICGFLMRRFPDARIVQNVYQPKKRKSCFPRADWAFLIGVASRCAEAVAAVHASGCVVGDINPSNVLVTPGEVGLIDCDSFQIPAPGELHFCEVGFEDFTPPELQGVSFAQTPRTPNHDAFALAVLIFHLLFMGRHPFVGRPDEDENPAPADLIRDRRFAYSRMASQLRIAPPPGVPTLDLVGNELAEMFEAAFLAGGYRPATRPKPAQWLAQLERLTRSLRRCAQDGGHQIPGHLGACPWCEIQRKGGLNFFEGVAAAGVVFRFEAPQFQAFTKRAEKSSEQNYEYHLPAQPVELSIAPEPLPEGLENLITLHRIAAILTLAGPLLFLGGCYSRALPLIGLGVSAVFGAIWGVIRYLSPLGQELRRRQAVLADAQHRLNEVTDRIQSAFASTRRLSERLLAEIKELLDRWQRLPHVHTADHARLERDKELLARAEYLRNQFLAEHDIPRIGRARKAVLASFGIETASDVEAQRILAIRGFGQKLTETLVAWRNEVLARFQFDAKVGVPKEERERVELKYQQAQDGLRIQLQDALHKLETEIQRLRQEVHPLEKSVAGLLDAFNQANADLQVIPTIV